MRHTYAYRKGRFANDVSVVRCATEQHIERMQELGFERCSRTDAARLVRWVNAENAAWGSGNAFGFIDAKSLFDPNDPTYSAESIEADR